MDNHVHLIIKTGKEPLRRIMRGINSIYTRYFNKKYNYISHLFQAKYFSQLIESDKQILEASKYVHLSPVRAKMDLHQKNMNGLVIEYLWEKRVSFAILK